VCGRESSQTGKTTFGPILLWLKVFQGGEMKQSSLFGGEESGLDRLLRTNSDTPSWWG